MDRKLRRLIKKHIVTIWIVVAALALSFIVVMAVYPTKQNKAKKVIALQSDNEMQFSSNYLDEDELYRTIIINDGDPINVDIRNYSKSNATRFYSSSINYRLDAVLTDASGRTLDDTDVVELLGNDEVTIYKVVTTTENDITTTNDVKLFTLTKTKKSDYNDSQKLEGNATTKAVQTYKIYFPSASSKVCVKLVATPDGNVHKDLREISAIFAVSDKSNIQGEGWTGEFNDPESKGPSDYDAFNYTITGHGDSKTATIQWNSNVVSLNKGYFLSDFNNTDLSTATDIPGKTGWKKITIPLDSDHNNGRYSFQVFKASGFNSFIISAKDDEDPTADDWTSEEEYLWDKLNDCIIFDDGI